MKFPFLNQKNLKPMIIAFAVLVLLGSLAYGAISLYCNNYNPEENSGSDKTPLNPQSNFNTQPTPIPSYPTTTPFFNPNPTPTSWINPTPEPETPVSATVWQTCYVTNLDGSTYWVNPPKPFALALLGAENKDPSTFKQVKTLQNNIYMKIDSDKTVQSWLFSAKETIGIYNENGFEVGTITENAQLNQNGYAVTNGQNTYVLGASISANQLEPLIEQVTRQQCYFVIKLTDIQLALTFTDGSTEILTANYGNIDNTLAWLIDTT